MSLINWSGRKSRKLEDGGKNVVRVMVGGSKES